MGNKSSKEKEVKIINTPVVFQTNIMVVQTKLNLNRNKKVEMIKRKRKEVAECLLDNNLDIAKAKMDSIIREEDLITIYDILGPICEILKEKVTYLLTADKCPDDLRAPLDTLIYASSRMEIDELHKIRDLVRRKYGEVYIAKANTNTDGLVNLNVLEKLKIRQTADPYIIARLKQFCIDEEIRIEFPQDVIPVVTNHESFNNYANQYSSMGGKIIPGNQPLTNNLNNYPGMNNFNMTYTPNMPNVFPQNISNMQNMQNSQNIPNTQNINISPFPNNNFQTNFHNNLLPSNFQDFSNKNINMNNMQISAGYNYKESQHDFKQPIGNYMGGNFLNPDLNRGNQENLEIISNPNITGKKKSNLGIGTSQDINMQNNLFASQSPQISLQSDPNLEFPTRFNNEINTNINSQIKPGINPNLNLPKKLMDIQTNLPYNSQEMRNKMGSMTMPKQDDKMNPYSHVDFPFPTRSVVMTGQKQTDQIKTPDKSPKVENNEEFGSSYLNSPKPKKNEINFDINQNPFDYQNDFNLIKDNNHKENQQSVITPEKNEMNIDSDILQELSKSASHKIYSNEKNSTPKPIDDIEILDSLNKQGLSKSLKLSQEENKQEIKPQENIKLTQIHFEEKTENKNNPPESNEMIRDNKIVEAHPIDSEDFNFDKLFPKTQRTLSTELPSPKYDGKTT